MAGKKSSLAKAAERAVLYLMDFRSYAGELDGPMALTQDSIADAIGMARPNVPRAISGLVKDGIVGRSKVHVPGIRLKRTIYFLTEYGRIRARALREKILAREITVKFPDGSTERMTVGEALRAMPADIRLVDIVREANDTLVFDMGRFTDAAAASRLPAVLKPYVDLEHFCGREKEMADIRAWLDSPVSNVLVLQGMPGIGKTSLLCRALASAPGYRVHYQAVQRWSSRKSVLASLADFLRDNGSPQLHSYMEAGGGTDLYETGLALAEALGGPANMLLVFDDLHNASPGVMDILALLNDLAGEAGFKMVASGRVVEPFYDRRDVSIEGSVTELTLSGLDERCTRKLARSLGVEQEHLDTVVRRTSGHPLFIELISKASGKINGSHDIERYILEEFAGSLSPGEMALLRYLAVHRYPVETGSLRQGRDMLNDLARRSVVVMQDGTVRVHDLLGECIYTHMPEAELTRNHRRAAEHYLARLDPMSQLEACHHLVQAGEAEAVADIMASQGERMLTSASPEEMTRILAAAMVKGRLSGGDRRMPYLIYLQARCLFVLGQWDDALEHFRRARELAPEPDSRLWVCCSMGIAEILLNRDSYRAALDMLEETLGHAGEVEEARHVLPDILYHMGSVMERLGQYDDALEHFRRSLDMARDFGDRLQQARAVHGIGRIQHRQGDYEAALESRRRALDISLQMGDRHTGAKIMTGMGWTLSEMGRLDEALEMHRRAADTARESGAARTLGYALSNLGAVCIDNRDLKMASQALDEAADIFRRLGENRMLATALLNRAIVEVLRNRMDNSAGYLESCVDILKEMRNKGDLADAYCTYAECLGEAGMQKEAIRYGKKAQSAARGLGDAALQDRISRLLEPGN